MYFPAFFSELTVRIISEDATVNSAGIQATDYVVKAFLFDTENYWTQDENGNMVSNSRKNSNIAIIKTKCNIDFKKGTNANAACLPSCKGQFDEFTFSNGTGTRCWQTGWTKSGKDYTQTKFTMPLVPDRQQCQKAFIDHWTALGKGNSPAIKNFQVKDDELCAGGSGDKESCVGDGGNPMVCLSGNGNWYVTGLVSWAIGGCGDGKVPNFNVNVWHFMDLINKYGDDPDYKPSRRDQRNCNRAKN